MLVGICEIELLIYESYSLKEKRSTVKSIINRLKHKYNISIAEVDLLDQLNRSGIGFAIVSNDKRYIEEVISKVINFIDNDSRVEILNENYEII